jgi:pullulanase
MPADLLQRKKTHFVLWRPGVISPSPAIYLNTLQVDSFSLKPFKEIALIQSEPFPDLWEIAAQDCGLVDGQVYFYWFKVCNTDPYDVASSHQVLYCTDPMAWTVDRRFLAPKPLEPGGTASMDPASVVLYQQDKLIACDPGGQIAHWEGDSLDHLPPNNRLVIYELPTRWASIHANRQVEEGNGTFQDVLSLLLTECISSICPATLNNRAHLIELGINALELLPPADSDDDLNWGYGTANFFAADFNLGFPEGQMAPTASTDLVNLIKICHQQGIRFFKDAVISFARNNPYRNINFSDFYVKFNSGDPEQGARDGFGGDLFKYRYEVEGYDPITGKNTKFYPARQYMKTYIAHWMEYYRIDGLRLDSVNNIDNYDFLEEIKEFSRALWHGRGGKEDQFLVVGEELSFPIAMVQQHRLDGMWNECFKRTIRQVILGRNADDEPSFEWSVRKLIDCRNLGFEDGSEAINYLTSHDVGGMGNERMYNWLINNGIIETEQRIKLAFVCLLTAVGIPMILAGDEFADQQDLPTTDAQKQVDPVNYSRMQDAWRQRIFAYVTRLIKLRNTSEALASNDTNFIHVDFSEGKRVLVWQRGARKNPVIVIANFSDYGSPPTADYHIPHWPLTPPGVTWQEVTQERDVPQSWIGREPIFPWEAKVYTWADHV